MNGVRIDDAEANVDEGIRTLELPSGTRAEVRKGHGRDLMRAQRAAAEAETRAQ